MSWIFFESEVSNDGRVILQYARPGRSTVNHHHREEVAPWQRYASRPKQQKEIAFYSGEVARPFLDVQRPKTHQHEEVSLDHSGTELIILCLFILQKWFVFYNLSYQSNLLFLCNVHTSSYHSKHEMIMVRVSMRRKAWPKTNKQRNGSIVGRRRHQNFVTPFSRFFVSFT